MIKKIAKVLKEKGVTKAGLFGSYARGEETSTSDVDILVKLKSSQDLFDLVSIERELKIVIKKKVDLVTYNGLNPKIKSQILTEEVKII